LINLDLCINSITRWKLHQLQGLQVSHKSIHPQHIIYQLEYDSFNIGFNDIGAEETLHLSKSNWKKLQKIDLCNGLVIEMRQEWGG
jgi:hypothetical protein